MERVKQIVVIVKDMYCNYKRISSP
jgi:hypothetical protein